MDQVRINTTNKNKKRVFLVDLIKITGMESPARGQDSKNCQRL